MRARLKTLFYGIAAIILIGIGGFVYRNAVEHSQRQITCPQNTLTCPDGTQVSRLGNTCSFPACGAPNVSFPEVDIAFAVPDGFSSTTPPDSSSIAAYRTAGPTPQEPSDIIIRRFAVSGSSTPLSVIAETAIGGASGEPVPATAYTSSIFGTRRFTVVAIERFEAVITTAYYVARATDVLRFDATDRGVANWTDPNLDLSTLPAHKALRQMLATFQSE